MALDPGMGVQWMNSQDGIPVSRTAAGWLNIGSKISSQLLPHMSVKNLRPIHNVSVL